MPFPSLVPSSRDYAGGDFPVRMFKAQSGVEARILYGSRRTGMKLSLSFDNVTDAQAEQFLDHYDETKGTYLTFSLPAEAFTGWNGNRDAIDAAEGNSWRYEDAPTVTNVRPNVSTVQARLVGVL